MDADSDRNASFSDEPIPAPKPEAVSAHNRPLEFNKDRMRYVVIDCLDARKSRQEIKDKLIAHGYSEMEADQLIDDVKREQRMTGEYDAAIRGNPLVHLIAGAILFLIGVGATIGSLFALAHGGAVFLFAWIPLVLGVFQLYRGLSQWNKW